MAFSDLFIRYLQKSQECSSEDLSRLRSLRTRLADVENGQVILPGEEAEPSCGLMLRGMAGRTHRNLGSPEAKVISGLFVAGDMIEPQGFVRQPLQCDIISMGRSRVELISHEELRRITRDFPKLMELLWLETAIDSGVQRQWQVAAASLRSSAHLAHLFCELHIRLSRIGEVQDMRLNLPILQKELAEIIGYSSIHVNRSVRDLRDRGLVRWIGPEVVVLDLEGLRRLARFDPSYLAREPIGTDDSRLCAP